MGHDAAVVLRSLYMKWVQLFYGIVAYGVIERLFVISVIRNKKYKPKTGLPVLSTFQDVSSEYKVVRANMFVEHK
jgi:hypothetical protein